MHHAHVKQTSVAYIHSGPVAVSGDLIAVSSMLQALVTVATALLLVICNSCVSATGQLEMARAYGSSLTGSSSTTSAFAASRDSHREPLPPSRATAEDCMAAGDLTGPALSSTVSKCTVSARVAAVLGERGPQLVWMDEERKDLDGRRLSTLTRCLAASQHGSEWSEPTAIGQSTSWNRTSIAVGFLPTSGGRLLVALWQGRNDRLTYVTSADGLSWSQPMEKANQVGSRNWLCSTPRGTVLITQDGGHLYAQALTRQESQ